MPAEEYYPWNYNEVAALGRACKRSGQTPEEFCAEFDLDNELVEDIRGYLALMVEIATDEKNPSVAAVSGFVEEGDGSD